MDTGEQIRALLAAAEENSAGIKELLVTTREHTKQLELDGQFIKQLAMIVQDRHGEIEKLSEDVREMMNGIQALVEVSALHETRLNQIEGGEA